MSNDWIENTGVCPAAGDGIVMDLKFRDGSIETCVECAEMIDWSIEYCAFDVTHYRIREVQDEQD